MLREHVEQGEGLLVQLVVAAARRLGVDEIQELIAGHQSGSAGLDVDHSAIQKVMAS